MLQLIIAILILIMTGCTSPEQSSQPTVPSIEISELKYESLTDPDVGIISQSIIEKDGKSVLQLSGDIIVEPEELVNLFNTFEELYGEYSINEEHYVSYTYDEEKGGMEKGFSECYELIADDVTLSISSDINFDGTYCDPYFCLIDLKAPATKAQTSETQENIYTLLKNVFSDEVAYYMVYKTDEEELESILDEDDLTNVFNNMSFSYSNETDDLDYHLSRDQYTYDEDGDKAFWDWGAHTAEYRLCTFIGDMSDIKRIIEVPEIPEPNNNVKDIVKHLDILNKESEDSRHENPNGVDRIVFVNTTERSNITTYDFEDIFCSVTCFENGESTVSLSTYEVFEWCIDYEKVEPELLKLIKTCFPNLDIDSWNREEGKDYVKYSKIIGSSNYSINITERLVYMNLPVEE